MTVKVFAPAKINLSLHITGLRDDGYHLLDSLVAFGPAGDSLTIEQSDRPSFRVIGLEASGVPTGESNLICQALRMCAPDQNFAVTLIKNLPMAAGIGGGSADAAATVRGLATLLDQPEILENLDQLARLGADVPMCLSSSTVRVYGIGEQLVSVEFPSLPTVLVNPRIAVSTPQVFKVLSQKTNPAMDATLPIFSGLTDFMNWLADQRNDLAPPVQQLHPEIDQVLNSLRDGAGNLLARMSGSGSTCFGIYHDMDAASAAAKTIQDANPNWWISAGHVGDYSTVALPTIS